MLNEFLTGASYLPRGFRLLRTPGVRPYAALPLLANILAFTVLIAVGVSAFGDLMDWLMPARDRWWVGAARWLLWVIFGFSALLLLFFTFTLVANLLGAPFNGMLAAAVEQRLLGTTSESPLSWKQLLRDVVPSLLNEVRKLAYYLAWALPLLVIFVLPVVQLLAPAAWLLFSAWMMSLQYLDYPMSNHELRFRQVRACLTQHRWLGLGFGAAVMAATLVPLVNFFVMPAAVAGATALWLEQITGSGGGKQHR